MLHNFIHFVLHLDTSLAGFIQHYGHWAYALLFVIIFCETGLVVTPFLPGDSLLFAAGAMAAMQLIDISTLLLVLGSAAILGDQSNYWIGRSIGRWLMTWSDHWYFKKKYLQRTHAFYETYGGRALIIARFAPILRTFAPFIAGVSKMTYLKFCCFSVGGGILWISVVTCAGFLFSHIPLVKNNFSFVIVAIIIISLMPALIEFYRVKLCAR